MYSVSDIHSLIKKSRFSKNDVYFGTEGQCASFALALFHFLKEKGMKPKLYVMSDGFNNRVWGHVLVLCLNTYFDITGRVVLDNKYFKAFGSSLFPISEKTLLRDIKFLKKHEASLYDNKDKYNTWKNKLSKPNIEPSIDTFDKKYYQQKIQEKEKIFLKIAINTIKESIPHVKEIWLRGAIPQGLKSDIWHFAIFIEEEDYDRRNYFSNRKHTLQYSQAVTQLKMINGNRVDIKIDYPNKRNEFYKLTQKEGFLLWKSEK